MKKEVLGIEILKKNKAKEAAEIYNFSLRFLARNKPISKEKMEELIERKNNVLLGLFFEGRLIGHSILSLDEKTTVGSIGLVLHPEWQGKGLGKKLLEETLKIAQQKGCKKVIAEILATNVRSIRFFEKVGFKFVGESERKIIKRGEEMKVLKYEITL
jgi:RimJ/RimL family protein N-acetyltransferase